MDGQSVWRSTPTEANGKENPRSDLVAASHLVANVSLDVLGKELALCSTWQRGLLRGSSHRPNSRRLRFLERCALPGDHAGEGRRLLPATGVLRRHQNRPRDLQWSA